MVKLKLRAEEVGIDYHVVGLIRDRYYNGGPKNIMDLITYVEVKLKVYKEKTQGKKFNLYTEALKALSGMRHPDYLEVIRPYD